MAGNCRSHIFLIFLLHRQYGPLVGGLKVSRKPDRQWQTEWEIGTIDRDSRLSDHWFCSKEYENRFRQVLQAAAHKSAHFDLPGATSRWGMAAGMSHKNALDLAHQLQALWQEIFLDWETRGCVGEDIKP